MYLPPMDNESGIAYGWLVLSIFLILFGLLYLYLEGVVNSFITGPAGDNTIGINHDIAAGKLSAQGVGALNFNIQMFENAPLMIIIGAFIFAVTRAIVVKQVA